MSNQFSWPTVSQKLKNTNLRVNKDTSVCGKLRTRVFVCLMAYCLRLLYVSVDVNISCHIESQLAFDVYCWDVDDSVWSYPCDMVHIVIPMSRYDVS